MKKELGIIFTVISVILFGIMIYEAVIADYQYNRDIYSYWSLADKASTISQKYEYITLFVDALDKSGLQGSNNAILLKTKDNSFDYNFQALQSLQNRLQNISTMDENSFAYQTAIQQITAQEQGEAEQMLDVFAGCWYLVHYPLLWDWICAIVVLLLITLLSAGVILIIVSVGVL